MQTKRNSFYEACINTLIGFIVTLVFSPFIYSLCGIKTNAVQLGLATFYFTALSVARSYVVRRFFNGLKPKEKKKDLCAKLCIRNGNVCSCPPQGNYIKSNLGICQYCGELEIRP